MFQSSNDRCRCFRFVVVFLIQSLSITTLFSEALSASSSSKREQIRIVSWNILADEYAKPEKYPRTSTCDLAWETRSERILQRFERFNADIICLQEVQLSTWPFFALECETLGYNCDLIQNVTREHPVALAILYQPGLVKVLAVESRSRALLAALRLRHTGQVVFLANIHFQAGRDSQAEEQRYFQIRSLMRRIQLHVAQHSNYMGNEDMEPNIILVGDFNMNRSSGMYRLLSRGSNQFAHSTREVNKGAIAIPRLPFLPLKDAYNVVHKTHGRLGVAENAASHQRLSTFRTGCTYDYVFTSSLIEATPWHDDAPLLQTEQLQLQLHQDTSRRKHNHYAWPNAEHPSDHWPIGVDLVIKA